MSAAKMVADSTQSDEPAIKKKKITVKKNKKGKKTADKKLSKKKIDKEDPTDPNLDLSKDVRPIRDYWQNRSEMLEQMFESVQGPSLTMILPEALIEMDMKELKSYCLEQLEVMSKKRIFRILAGDEPDSISSSGTEDELDACEERKGQVADSTSNTQPEILNYKIKEEENDAEVIEVQNSTDKDVGNKPQDDSPCTGLDSRGLIAFNDIKVEVDSECEATVTTLDSVDTTLTNDNNNTDTHTRVEKSENMNNSDNMNTSSSTTSSDSSSLIPMLTQNHMELLELEMRARAIKAMLKAQESSPLS